jgi:16S rRNA (cytidine1402-2'-O)-methyltransferase
VSRHRKDPSSASPSHPAPDTAPGFEAGIGHEKNSGESHQIATSAGDLAPGLYVTATPIGNASDISLRALNVLKHCDAIIAEDTRVTSRLLAIHGISRRFLTYNDHNAAKMRPKILAELRADARLALVSDAGTPLISDPGLKLVREALADGIAVHPIPGPSAAIAALSISGLATDRFLFAGFLPSRKGERQTALAELRAIPATLVFYESPNRLAESLKDMAETLGPDRDGVVARELTKLHEDVTRGTLARLADAFDGVPLRGEITILVAPPAKAAPDFAKAESLLKAALAFMPVSAAASLVAEATGGAKRELYARALALKQEADDEP